MMKCWIASLLTVLLVEIRASPTPIVLWHGMGDTCCMSFSLGSFKKFLEKQIPGVYVYSLRIGENTVEDFENGYFMNPNKQVEYACNKLMNDKNLMEGFNIIGFSQGCQFARALVQRCGHLLRVKSLISLGGQHQGVYGVPRCGPVKHPTCDYVRQLINHAAYVKWVQNALVQATYWHDPLDEQTYKQSSIFLADINNERRVNKTYVQNLNKLQNFVMVKFFNDTIVEPKDTEWFEFYAPGQSKEIIPLQQSDLYVKDRLGLKRMDKQGRLVFLGFPGDHLQFSTQWFITNIIDPYLK